MPQIIVIIEVNSVCDFMKASPYTSNNLINSIRPFSESLTKPHHIVFTISL